MVKSEEWESDVERIVNDCADKVEHVIEDFAERVYASMSNYPRIYRDKHEEAAMDSYYDWINSEIKHRMTRLS